ncbi:glutamate--cysteine ligase [Eionea flava]
MTHLTNILRALSNAPNQAGIADIVRGLEKESLRIKPNGTLASSQHPPALGSALTHPHITTDYSEALLEFITDPSASASGVLQQLTELHAYTCQNLNGERLWPTSMPCMLGRDEDIPIAQYGSSNSGKMKSAYRMGLGHRYGRSMQTIAGLHYNFSVSEELWDFLHKKEKSALSIEDFKTQGYFHLIRNFRRYFWLLLYLFGASPGVCKSFVSGREHQLVPFGEDQHSLHMPYATSLRMGDLGYQSSAQESLVITYNCLESYIKTLCSAITHTHAGYESIGTKDSNGCYQQLNANLLQIENEFYSVIRPKRTAQRGETALSALANGGVEYIEVRCLDLNPFEPLGINESNMRFLDTFLLYCLLSDSAPSDEHEHDAIQENQKRMVYNGRDPELKLLDREASGNMKERPMREWADSLMQDIQLVSNVLSEATGEQKHNDSLQDEWEKLRDDRLTPSARVLDTMSQENKTFYRFAADLATQHQHHFTTYPLAPKKQAHLSDLAQLSLTKQRDIENSDNISFDQYLEDYYSQYECNKPAYTP